MEVVATRDEFRKATSAARASGSEIGLVPTMGAFHQGHMALLRAAASSCDVVAASIFVNPLSSPLMLTWHGTRRTWSGTFRWRERLG